LETKVAESGPMATVAPPEEEFNGQIFIIIAIFICIPSLFVYTSRITWWWPAWAETCCEWNNKHICLCDSNSPTIIIIIIITRNVMACSLLLQRKLIWVGFIEAAMSGNEWANV
jgi:hypothetical protein